MDDGIKGLGLRVGDGGINGLGLVMVVSRAKGW